MNERGTPKAYIELNGWDNEDQIVEASDYTRPGETTDEAIDRLARSWGIIEIGDCRITEGR